MAVASVSWEGRHVSMSRFMACLAGVVMLITGGSTRATGDVPWMDLGAEGAITLTPQPVVGDTVQVVFTFIVHDSLLHSRQRPDSAWIRCRDTLVRFVDGDTLWSGCIQTGRQYELRARCQVVSGTRFNVWGGVSVRQALGKVGPSLDPGVPDSGVYARKTFGSESFDLRSENEIARSNRQPMPRLLVSDSGVVLADTEWTDLRFRRTPQPILDRSNHEPPLRIDLLSSDTIRVTCPMSEPVEFVYKSPAAADTVKVTRLIGDADFIRTGGRTGQFESAVVPGRTVFRVSDGRTEKILILDLIAGKSENR